MYERIYYREGASAPPFSYPAGGDTFEEAVLALTPDAYWRLGESSGNAADSSGNSRTLTAGGTITYGEAGWAGDGDTAMTFTSGDSLTRADEALWDVGTSDFTVMWAHKVGPGWPTDQQLIGHDGQGFAGEWYVRMSATTDAIRIRLQDAVTGTLTTDFVTTADSLDTGAWVFCVITFDRSGNAILYVDGYTEYTQDISSASAYNVTNARALWLAGNSASGARDYLGSLDEVAFWKGTLLTQSQVRALYDARNGSGGSSGASDFANTATNLAPTTWWRLGEASGTTVTDSRGVVDGSYVNTPTLGVSGYAADDTGVTLASASSEYVSVPSDTAFDFGTGDFSAHVAMKTSSWPVSRSVLMARGNGWGSGDWMLFLNQAATNRVSLLIVGVQYNFDTGVSLADGAWHSLGLSCDRSGNATLYVDGSSVGTADISAQSAVNVSGSRAFGIGAQVDPSVADYLNGSLDEVMVWKGTLIGSADWSALHAARSA